MEKNEIRGGEMAEKGSSRPVRPGKFFSLIKREEI